MKPNDLSTLLESYKKQYTEAVTHLGHNRYQYYALCKFVETANSCVADKNQREEYARMAGELGHTMSQMAVLDEEKKELDLKIAKIIKNINSVPVPSKAEEEPKPETELKEVKEDETSDR